MQPDEKQNTIVSILNKLRKHEPKIGQHKKSIYTIDKVYHVKLDNGRIVLNQELIDDYELHPDFITEDQLKNALKSFRMDEITSTEQPEAKIESPTAANQTKKPFPKILKQLLVTVVILVVVVAGVFAFQAIRENQRKELIRGNIEHYVTASGSTYLYSELGGISDFSVTVRNKSGYVINQVRVKVTYIKSNGGTWKEELLDFSYILPYQSQTIKAPDSERGTKVKYEIVSIVSYDLSLY